MPREDDPELSEIALNARSIESRRRALTNIIYISSAAFSKDLIHRFGMQGVQEITRDISEETQVTISLIEELVEGPQIVTHAGLEILTTDYEKAAETDIPEDDTHDRVYTFGEAYLDTQIGRHRLVGTSHDRERPRTHPHLRPTIRRPRHIVNTGVL